MWGAPEHGRLLAAISLRRRPGRSHHGGDAAAFRAHAAPRRVMPVPYALWEPLCRPRAAGDGAVAVTTSPEGCTSAAAGLGWAG